MHDETARSGGNDADVGSGKIAARQSNNLAPQLNVRLADHHTHIWSLNALRLVTEPLRPVVELPEELKRLLQDKERFGGRDENPFRRLPLMEQEFRTVAENVAPYMR